MQRRSSSESKGRGGIDHQERFTQLNPGGSHAGKTEVQGNQQEGG